MKLKLTRRALLIDCLNMMTSIQRNLSQNWTLLEPRDGCEGAWDLVKLEADMLREMIHEIDAEDAKAKERAQASDAPQQRINIKTGMTIPDGYFSGFEEAMQKVGEVAEMAGTYPEKVEPFNQDPYIPT